MRDIEKQKEREREKERVRQRGREIEKQKERESIRERLCERKVVGDSKTDKVGEKGKSGGRKKKRKR